MNFYEMHRETIGDLHRDVSTLSIVLTENEPKHYQATRARVERWGKAPKQAELGSVKREGLLFRVSNRMISSPVRSPNLIYLLRSHDSFIVSTS